MGVLCVTLAVGCLGRAGWIWTVWRRGECLSPVDNRTKMSGILWGAHRSARLWPKSLFSCDFDCTGYSKLLYAAGTLCLQYRWCQLWFTWRPHSVVADQSARNTHAASCEEVSGSKCFVSLLAHTVTYAVREDLHAVLCVPVACDLQNIRHIEKKYSNKSCSVHIT